MKNLSSLPALLTLVSCATPSGSQRSPGPPSGDPKPCRDALDSFDSIAHDDLRFCDIDGLRDQLNEAVIVCADDSMRDRIDRSRRLALEWQEFCKTPEGQCEAVLREVQGRSRLVGGQTCDPKDVRALNDAEARMKRICEGIARKADEVDLAGSNAELSRQQCELDGIIEQQRRVLEPRMRSLERK